MTDVIIPLSNNQPIITTVKTHLEVTCDPAFDEAWINGVRYVPAPEDLAVTPAADDRGPGSVAERGSPVATDEKLRDLFVGWPGALPAIYNLGREHGAANSKPTPNPSQIRSSSPEPAAAPDRPLWELMQEVYFAEKDSRAGCASELRVLADELERRQMKQVFQDLDDVIDWLRAEAERAENPNESI